MNIRASRLRRGRWRGASASDGAEVPPLFARWRTLSEDRSAVRVVLCGSAHVRAFARAVRAALDDGLPTHVQTVAAGCV